jgi:hypothetical protein
MKFLSMVLMVLFSVVFVNAQNTSSNKSGGVTANKNGVSAKGAKGGKAAVTKKGAVAKSANGKGVEANKNGTKTTPATK